MNIYIDNKKYDVYEELTIFQQCALLDVHLPCFCYHEKLDIAGNCRICLVEVNTVVNLVVSCATTITEGMSIYTDSERVRKAREGVMEYLLANHPLDCPICDQAGDVIYRIFHWLWGQTKVVFMQLIKELFLI